MAQRSQYFDSVDGDRIYDSADFARHLSALTSDGFILGIGGQLEVSEDSPLSMEVIIDTGQAWVNGRFFEVHTTVETLTIPTANPDNPRIDRIVVERDVEDREVRLAVLQGDPAIEPDPPTLTRNGTIWQISLAQVYVEANATTISNDEITDERANRDVCGVSLPLGIFFQPVGAYLAAESSPSIGVSADFVDWDIINYLEGDIEVDGNQITVLENGIYTIDFRAEVNAYRSGGGDHGVNLLFRINEAIEESFEQLLEDLGTSIGTDGFMFTYGLSWTRYLEAGDSIDFVISFDSTGETSEVYVDINRELLTTLDPYTP